MVPSTPADTVSRRPARRFGNGYRGPGRCSCEGEWRLRLVGRLGRRPDFPGVARAAPYLGVGVLSLDAAQAFDDVRHWCLRRDHRQGGRFRCGRCRWWRTFSPERRPLLHLLAYPADPLCPPRPCRTGTDLSEKDRGGGETVPLQRPGALRAHLVCPHRREVLENLKSPLVLLHLVSEGGALCFRHVRVRKSYVKFGHRTPQPTHLFFPPPSKLHQGDVATLGGQPAMLVHHSVRITELRVQGCDLLFEVGDLVDLGRGIRSAPCRGRGA